MSAPVAGGGRYGVLLMTYGSPSSLDDVQRYITAARGGRGTSDELAAEFRRRYEVIGGSPLIAITEAQASALEARLAGEALVRAGMRFSAPSIADQLRALADLGVRRVIAIVMSPQYSELLMGGYRRAIEAARAELGDRSPMVEMAGTWYLEPAFVAALAGRITKALESFSAGYRHGVPPVLLTAHSLPRRVAEQEPDYLQQLLATATAVADEAGLTAKQWTFCWQSAGHEPGEWMKPDFAELMPQLAAAGHHSVLVAPIQFLADHLEILYDVDVGARQQAETAGLAFARIESLNVDEGLIDALAAVARRTASWPVSHTYEAEAELGRAVARTP
jgi:ferrochelatase